MDFNTNLFRRPTWLAHSSVILYRDDGLAVTTLTPKETERIKKQICNVFKNNNLKITIEANKKVINFLDVTLDMNTEKFKPYAKAANTPLYVHSKSNHPPSIIKNIPESINRRLSEISSDAGVFDEAAKPYQEALGKSGYTFKLQFKPPQTSLPKRNRSRNIIWFNPPYNRNVKSNIGRQFLRLIDQSFPVGHKLRKIFNRNTLKLSYSCMPNVTQIISGHNKTILRKAAQTPQDQATKTCNCRKKDECPLKGTCLSEGVIYQATVTSLNNRTETYVGLTATNFKARWRNHQTSFNNGKSKNSTELSKYIWALKSKNERYTIGWKILERAKPYTNLTGKCQLCTAEKHFIITKPELATLNKRNELVSACRHRRKFILRYSIQ